MIKPSDFTPLVVPCMCSLISEHKDIDKAAFTGFTLVGSRIMEAAAKSNLKDVTLELGGNPPSTVFEDADLCLTVNCLVRGISCAILFMSMALASLPME